MSDTPNVSIVTLLHDWSELYVLFDHHWNTIEYPKEKLEWIIVDDSKEDHSHLIPSHNNILYIRISQEEGFLDKIEFPNDKDDVIKNLFTKFGRLPNGFLRDYAVGLTEHDYILHYDIDTIYNPKTLQRKLRFLKSNRLECIYCKAMLAYDIYGKTLYKVDDDVNGFESTLFHTRDFWKRSGFKWSDINNEAVSFYYGKGLDRQMDNYYDTIKILSVANIHNYRPKKIEVENLNIKIPEIVSTIQIDTHPLSQLLDDLYYKQNINVIGIDSEIIMGMKTNFWTCHEIKLEKKIKEKVIIQKIKELNLEKINICFLNTKFPIWEIFKKIEFDCVVLETIKNTEQMHSILTSNDYLLFENLYINKKLIH